MTVVAVVVVPIVVAGIEVQVVGVVAVAGIERRRPIVTVRTGIVERTTIAIAGGGKDMSAVI